MPDITDFEAFLLQEGQTNHHVYRKREVLLSLPADAEGASKALGLYQPQRPLARMSATTLRLLAGRGAHRFFLTKGKTATGVRGKGWNFRFDPETVGIMLGSSDHRVTRAIASYLGETGWEVAKIGAGGDARAMLLREAEVLKAVSEKGMNAPRCLGVHEQGDMTILRMPYLIGTPVAAETTDEALDLLEKWIGSARGKMLAEFDEWKHVRTALGQTLQGREALEGFSDRELQPVISHGDFARWNLMHLPDGNLVAMDWEWGQLAGMPGLDLVHYFAQDARLVQRLAPEEVILHIEKELEKPRPRDYLRRTGWSDCLIEPILAWAAFKQGVRHQKNPELLEACVREYLKRRNQKLSPAPQGGRTAPAPDGDRRKMLISVVTPSFHQVDFLKCCAASVRDQTGDVAVEHLIHDGGSGEEFDRWAAGQQHATCISEKDDGMYDAINRGFRKAKGEIIAWLNCDEQYLPGTLQRVAKYFEEHPETDILFGDLVLVDEVMTPLAYRRAVMPTLGHIRYSHLSTFSAATFVRRRVLDDGHYLQTRWKTIADAVWIEELLAAGYRAATLRMPLASFCMLGSNLGQSPLLFKERAMWEAETGATNKWSKRWYILEYRLERLRAGAYLMRKVTASCYIRGNPVRTTQERWVSGQWSVARDSAEEMRMQRDGAMGGLGIRLRPPRIAFLHAAAVIAISIYVDGLVAGDAVKGPSFLLFSLLYLSFRSRLKDLVPTTVAYFFISWYLLSERPTDVVITRLATFTFGAILAVFWAASLRSLEEWIRSTIMLIRRMNDPVVLTDRHGRTILVNNRASEVLGNRDVSLVGKKIVPLALTGEGRIDGRANVFDPDNRAPAKMVGLTLEGSNATLLGKAGVFVVGKGRFRVYAFTLHDPRATAAAQETNTIPA